MSFEERIPPEVHDELKDIIENTRRTNKEESVTWCRKPGSSHIFVASSAKGKEGSTEVLDCNQRFGASIKIGDAHTHPNTGIGTLPSEADLIGTLEDSFVEDNRQISCVANRDADYIECWQPKEVPDRKKINEYKRAADRIHDDLSDPYFYDASAKDFEFSFYDRKSGERLKNPDAQKVVKGAIGRSRPYLRQKLKDMGSIGGFCTMLENLTVPNDEDVFNACRKELREKRFLGIINY